MAERALPSFVQEDDERLLFGSRRLPVLLAEPDAVLVRRTIEPRVFEELQASLLTERASRVDEFDLIFPRGLARFEREVGLRDPVVEQKAEARGDLVGGLGTAHLHLEDGGVEAEDPLVLVAVDLGGVEFRGAAPEIGEQPGGDQRLKLAGLEWLEHLDEMPALRRGDDVAHDVTPSASPRLDFLDRRVIACKPRWFMDWKL